jgi:hypothetical protein
MTKITELVDKSLDRVMCELRKPDNRQRIQSYILDPIVDELGIKLQPYLYIIITMYVLIIIPLFVLLLVSLLKSRNETSKTR